MKTLRTTELLGVESIQSSYDISSPAVLRVRDFSAVALRLVQCLSFAVEMGWDDWNFLDSQKSQRNVLEFSKIVFRCLLKNIVW